MTKQTKEIADRLIKKYGSKREIKKEIKRRFEMINNRIDILNNSDEDGEEGDGGVIIAVSGSRLSA